MKLAACALQLGGVLKGEPATGALGEPVEPDPPAQSTSKDLR